MKYADDHPSQPPHIHLQSEDIIQNHVDEIKKEMQDKGKECVGNSKEMIVFDMLEGVRDTMGKLIIEQRKEEYKYAQTDECNREGTQGKFVENLIKQYNDNELQKKVMYIYIILEIRDITIYSNFRG